MSSSNQYVVRTLRQLFRESRGHKTVAAMNTGVPSQTGDIPGSSGNSGDGTEFPGVGKIKFVMGHPYKGAITNPSSDIPWEL